MYNHKGAYVYNNCKSLNKINSYMLIGVFHYGFQIVRFTFFVVAIVGE